ncbi:MAG: FAD-dependent oxidoreductase, partial [Acidobacteria bacterium]
MAPNSPLDAVDGRTLDAVVLGGGISGAATARELAARGYEVLLVEPRDIGWGTSGRSSRLVHGGLRYLASGKVGLVRRALRERLALVRAAPHLVRPCPFVLPLYDDDPLPWRAAAAAGLALYDLLARPRYGWPPPREIRPDQARILIPGLELRGVRRIHLYHDGVTDDRRLTLATALDAAAAGAVLATRCEAGSLEPLRGGIARLSVRDLVTGESTSVETRALINATGPWCDRTRDRLGLEGRPLLRPSRGAHLAVEGRIDAAALLRHPRDGRIVFLVPAACGFLAGTTTGDDGCPPDEVRATEEDQAYLREFLHAALPGGHGRVRAAFAGLRPLAAGRGHPDRLSRDARIVVERSAGVPVIHLVGGKLTLHRDMARRAADRLGRLVPPTGRPRP